MLLDATFELCASFVLFQVAFEPFVVHLVRCDTYDTALEQCSWLKVLEAIGHLQFVQAY